MEISPQTPLWLYCVLPVVLLIVLRFLLKTKLLRGKFRLKAADVTVPMLLFVIWKLSGDIYQIPFFSYLVVGLLIIGMLQAVFLAQINGEIIYKKFFKTYWRVCFLLTFVIYVVLVVLYTLKMIGYS